LVAVVCFTVCSFHWPAYKSPYFTKPSGEKIFCDVLAYVPYLRHRDPAWDEGSVAAAATSARNSIVPIRRIQFNDVPEEGGGGNAPALPVTTRKEEASPIAESETPSDDGQEQGTGKEQIKSFPNTPAEAKTLRHMLTHLPKNDHCEACTRANMVKKHARRCHTPSGPDAPTAFGDSVTADHLFSAGDKDVGTHGERYAMVVLDQGTRWRDCFPSAEKDTTQSRIALQSFLGPRVTVNTFQCDGARELYKAAAELGICPTTSRPYVPQSNSLVERAIRHVEEGTRTVLLHADFPL
jgi:hypothetical protein